MKNEVKMRHFRLVSKQWNRMFDEFMLEFYSRPASMFRDILLEHESGLYFSECYHCMYSLCIQKKEWFVLLSLHLVCKTFDLPTETAVKVSSLCNDICLYLNRIQKNNDFVFEFVYNRVVTFHQKLHTCSEVRI